MGKQTKGNTFGMAHDGPPKISSSKGAQRLLAKVVNTDFFRTQEINQNLQR